MACLSIFGGPHCGVFLNSLHSANIIKNDNVVGFKFKYIVSQDSIHTPTLQSVTTHAPTNTFICQTF